MKKIFATALVLICVLALAGCDKEENTVNIDFPFEVGEVENIEMYHYVGVPVSAEKKTVIAEDDIKNLYDKFERISLKNKEVEEIAGAEIISFRFNLSDGTNYDLTYGGHGVKHGCLTSATGGFEYFTSADILACWSNLNEELEAVPVEESEVPKYSDDSDTPDTSNALVPAVMYDGEIYCTTEKQIPVEVDESAIVGEVTSVVPLSQWPNEEGQANFGEEGMCFAVTSDGFLVMVENEWTLFEPQETE